VKLGKITLIKVLGWSSFVLWVGFIGLTFQYVGTRPSSPEPETGRVYALNSHGHVVYVTLRENVFLSALWTIGLGGGAAAIGWGQIEDLKRRRWTR